MSTASELDWYDEALESFVRGHMNMDMATWAGPNAWLIEPLIGVHWLPLMLSCAEQIESNNILLRDVTKALSPSVIRKDMRWVAWNSKVLNISMDARIKLMKFYRALLESRSSKDVFAKQSNIWHSDAEILSMLDEPFSVSTEYHRAMVARLSAHAPAVSYSLYGDFYYNHSYELFGLYQADKAAPGAKLMVRQFGPFKPTELWSDTKAFPINTIEIYCIYESGFEGQFDFINHFYTSSPIKNSLERHRLVVDGGIINDDSKIEKIVEAVEEMAKIQHARQESLNAEEAKKYAVLCKYYQWRNFFSTLGKEWRPPASVLESIAGTSKIIVDFALVKNDEEKRQFWAEAQDPRTGFKNIAFLTKNVGELHI